MKSNEQSIALALRDTLDDIETMTIKNEQNENLVMYRGVAEVVKLP